MTSPDFSPSPSADWSSNLNCAVYVRMSLFRLPPVNTLLSWKLVPIFLSTVDPLLLIMSYLVTGLLYSLCPLGLDWNESTTELGPSDIIW